jgi:rhamnosyltransferase
MNPLVSIVIPTLNGGPILRRLLEAIDSQMTDFGWEVIAMDSGSTDGTLDALGDHQVSVTSVPRGTFNHGTTRNAALAQVRGEFAVLIVQDAVPDGPDWLAELVRPLQHDLSLAGTFARQQAWPDASRLTAHYLARWVACEPDARTAAPLSSSQFAMMSPAERHIACVFDNVCSCIRLSVWRTHPFRATPIAEDLEWAREVLTSGYRLAYVPTAVVWHSHERPVRYELQRTYRVHQRLQALFGLSTIPTISALARAVCCTVPLHLRLAATEPQQRMRAIWRGAGLALAMPIGQYLGAKSAREGRELLHTEGV